jgi:uncharacterized BrkB/YihY/UPF0761 family membrane protein
MPTETVNAKLLGALIAWLGSVTLAITFCYLVLRKKANPRLHTILLLGLFASVLWACGYGFATTLVIRGMRGSVEDIGLPSPFSRYYRRATFMGPFVDL